MSGCPIARAWSRRLIDLRPGARRFDPVADRLLELDDLGGGEPVGRIELDGAAVLDQRGVERSFSSISRARLMCACAALCIARSSWILYSGLSGSSWTAFGVLGDGEVPVAVAGGVLRRGGTRGPPRTRSQ